jgi:hypothetical protein
MEICGGDASTRTEGKDEALGHLLRYAGRERWKEESARALAAHFAPVCESAEISEDELAGALGGAYYEMLQMCAFEDFCSRPTAAGQRNIIDEYLRQHAWRESIPGRDFLRALRNSELSLYEIIEVNPGRSLVLGDVVRGGAPVEIEDRLASESMMRWDRVAVRILHIGGRHHFSGTALHFVPDAAEMLLYVLGKIRERAAGLTAAAAVDNGPVTEDSLFDRLIMEGGGARVYTSIWMASTLRALSAPRPALVNQDREQIVFARVRFAVAKENREKAARLLDSAPGLERGVKKLSWTWSRAESECNEPKTPGNISLVATQADGSVVLGYLVLRGGRWLVLEVNSLGRAERGRAMLKELLGGLVGEPITETQSVDRALEDYQERGRPPAKDEPPPLSGEEAARAMREFVDRHYHHVMEERIPAIGNVTPREAVRTPAGREKVISWLKYLENGEARRARLDGATPYDFTWMWQELGLLDEWH